MDVLRGTPAFIVHSATNDPVRELDRAHVWFWDLDSVPQLDTARRVVLSANERARAERLRSPRLRRRFEARCMLVRHVLGPVVGVSPIISGAPVRGMADKCLAALDVPVTAAGVGGLLGARSAGGILDTWLVDDADAGATVDGVRVRAHPLWMTDEAATLAIVQAALEMT